MKFLLKVDDDLPDIYHPLALSIIGDTGDDIYGVKGIGSKTFVRIFSDLVQIVGGMGKLYENVRKSRPIFNTSYVKNPNKYIESVLQEENMNRLISKNLKLISFELISRELDNPTSTEMAERKKQIYRTMVQKELVSINVMKEVLERGNVYIGSDDLETLYYNSGV